MTGSTVRPPAYQLLADELREEITSGRLQPGERLPPEPELCVRTGVSRSTVREALRLLASQHLIVTTRGVTGGSFVSHPDAEQLSEALSTGLTLLTHSAGLGMADLLELRRALEIPAAGLAAARRTAGARGPAIVVQLFVIASGGFLVQTGPLWLGWLLIGLGVLTGLLIVLPPSTRALGVD